MRMVLTLATRMVGSQQDRTNVSGDKCDESRECGTWCCLGGLWARLITVSNLRSCKKDRHTLVPSLP